MPLMRTNLTTRSLRETFRYGHQSSHFKDWELTNACMFRYYDERPPGSESYRHSDRAPRSPTRGDVYRSNRSPPPRRGRTPPPYATDTYAPTTRVDRPRSRSPRRRSRSPAARNGRYDASGYRGKPKSPPHGYDSRRDNYARSPPRQRRYSRSPVKARSPAPVRREPPTDDRRPRSPYRGRQERPPSPPRERYERRGYSPRADTRYPPKENNYRPALRERSRSPLRRSEQISRIPSPISSHGSPHQVRSERRAVHSRNHSPNYANSRYPPADLTHRYRERSPRRARSPPPRRSSPPRRSPPRETRLRSPQYARDDYRNGATSASYSENPKKAPSAPSYRNGDSRPPPSAPPYNDRFTRDPLPPSDPPSAPVSMSAHNRPTSASVLSAPTRPRGGPSNVGREPPRDGPYGPPRGGGSRGGYHGPSPRHGSYDRPPAPTEGPPAGPRGGGPPPHHAARSGPAPYEHRPPFRTNNSSSTTYPRTQRFTQHLGNVSTVVPGGKVDKSNLDPAAEKRLTELEEGKKKLLEAIEEKQRVKRSGLRDWDRLERESRRDALKSEFAERHLESLAGEVGGSGAAF